MKQNPIKSWLLFACMGLSVIYMAGCVYKLPTLPQQTLRPESSQPYPEASTSADVAVNTLQIFFNRAVGSQVKVVPVSRILDKTLPHQEKLRQALKILLMGPTEIEQHQGFFTEIPSGTRLLNVKTTPKEVHVNLSQQFAMGGGSQSIRQRLEEISQTVMAIKNHVPIYLEVDGELLQVLGGEGLEVPQPINQNHLEPVTPKR